MMLDSNGLPMTTNHAGYDGGDSLANYCRWRLAEILIRPFDTPHLKALRSVETKDANGEPTGLVVRHPGTGLNPDGSPICNVPDFWNNPSRTSRDNMRALMWLVVLRRSTSDYTQAILDRVYAQYKKRGFIKSQNVDIMLPLQFATNPVTCLLRDLEIGFNTLVAVGAIPHVKYDKPWGFGKDKKFVFSWQDKDECDGDVNLVADFTGASLVRRTLLLTGLIKLYKMVRGGTYVRHYYRASSGNNPEIGELYAKLIEREFKG